MVSNEDVVESVVENYNKIVELPGIIEQQVRFLATEHASILAGIEELKGIVSQILARMSPTPATATVVSGTPAPKKGTFKDSIQAKIDQYGTEVKVSQKQLEIIRSMQTKDPSLWVDVKFEVWAPRG